MLLHRWTHPRKRVLFNTLTGRGRTVRVHDDTESACCGFGWRERRRLFRAFSTWRSRCLVRGQAGSVETQVGTYHYALCRGTGQSDPGRERLCTAVPQNSRTGRVKSARGCTEARVVIL